MRFSQVVLWVPWAVVCSGWTIPADMPDGIYSISIPGDYNENDDVVLGKRNDNLTTAHDNITITRLAHHNKRGKWFFSNVPMSGIPGPKVWSENSNPSPEQPFMPPLELPSREGSLWRERVPMPVSDHDCIYNVPALNRRDYRQAREGLMNYCDRFLVPARSRHIALSISGDVVVYVCNMRKRAVGCGRKEWEWAEVNVFDRQCESFVPAWVKMHYKHAQWRRRWNKEYGRAWRQMRICQDRKLKSMAWQGTVDDVFDKDEDEDDYDD